MKGGAVNVRCCMMIPWSRVSLMSFLVPGVFRLASPVKGFYGNWM
jgi:hypothetical protein